MAIKFLSGLNLSNVTAGSILKLDANGNIVAATAGTDYATSNVWSYTGQSIFRNSHVRIGTYQASVAPSARLHVFDYQTTDPKLLIEDGNTGDASMQFKISTQQYTMGIDNSDGDKFKISASSAFGTNDSMEIKTNGAVNFYELVSLPGNGTTSSREKLLDAHGTRAVLTKEQNAVYWQVAQGGNQFQITDAANGNDTKGNVLLHVSGNDADDNVLYLATASGKVSIGSTTAPSENLLVTGNARIYQSAASPVLLTLHNYQGDINPNGTQGNFIDFKMTDGNATFTPQARIGMLVKDSDGDGGMPSEGSGHFVIYTGEGTDNNGNGTLSEWFRVTDKGKVGIGTGSPTERLEVSGNIKTSGSIALNNGNITGVNQLEINDPGEGIIWKQGSSGDITLATVDDNADNILRLSGTGATLQIGTNTVWHSGDFSSTNVSNWNTAYGWGNHATAGYLTSSSTQSKYLRSDQADTATGSLTLSGGANISGGVQGSNSIMHSFFLPQNPEGSHVKAPWFFNDMAYARLRGATVSVTVNGGSAPSNSNIDAMLDASTGFWNMPTSGVTSVVIEMSNLPKTMYHGSHYGVTFGNTTWRAKNVIIETYYDGAWQEVKNVTNQSQEFVYGSKNSGNNAQTKLRWTFSNFNHTSMRIVSLFAYNYNAVGMPSLYLTKDGGDMYGNITFASQYGVRFNDEHTRIYTNTDSPEDLIVEADQNLHLNPDGSILAQSNISMEGGSIITTDSNNALVLRSDVQHGQGDEDAVISFKQSTTEHAKIDQGGYMYATGFKTTTASTGLLKADGTVDTTTLGTMASESASDYKDSDTVETYVATELTSYTPTSSFGSNAFTSYTDHSTQGYLTSLPSHNHDDIYYTETELNGFFKSITHQGNYISTADWSLDGSGSVDNGWSAEGYPFSPTGSFNRNGSDSENNRILQELPNGAYGVVWRTPSNDASSDADGGWDMDIYNVHHSKAYRSIVMFQKTDDSTSGTFYHGCHGSHTLQMNGTAHTNPYFQTVNFSNLVQGRWYVSVGYIQPYQYPTATDSTRSGIYDCYTGKKVVSGVDYMMKSGSTTQRHRTYQYYSTDTNSSINWWNPRFEEINGNEPSIAELIQKVSIDGELGLNFHSKFPAGALDSLTEATDATNDKILLWDESADVWKQMTLEDLQDSIDNNTTYSAATTSTDGLMSSTDKTKLDGIATGAEVNVQADWNATSGDAFIQNKPTLGTASASAATDFVAVTGDSMSGVLSVNYNGIGLEVGNSANSGADTGVRIRGARNGQSYSTGNLTSYILLSNFDNNTTPNNYDLVKIGGGMYDSNSDTGFLRIETNNGTALTKALDIDKNQDAKFYGDVDADGNITASNLNVSNWDTAYTDRNKWDGGSTGLNAATGRSSLGLGSAATQSADNFVSVSGDEMTGDLIFRNNTSTDNTIIRDITWNTSAAEGTDDRIGVIRTYTSGGTADRRGGQMNFYTRNHSSSSFNTMIYDNGGNLYVPSNVYSNSNQLATQSYVDTAVANVVDSAPAALDTLNELAAALGDDASFSTTMTTALGNRLRIDVNNQSLSSTELSNARTNLGLGTAATAAATSFVAVSGDQMTGKLEIAKESQHVTQGSISANNAHLDLYNTWSSNTDQKGSIITFTDNYFDGSNYNKTLRAAIKGGTDTVGNTADGYLEFYTDSAGANSPNLVLRLDKNKNANFYGSVTVSGRTYLSTVDANASSTTALVLGTSGEIEKRTLGSNAFNSTAYLEDITPATPSVDSATVVGETIEITFSQSSTPGVDYYQVWSAVGSSTGSYGLIAHIPQEDVASSMTVIDSTFSVSDTMYYRVYAVKSGVYSTAGTTSRAFSASALDVSNMSVVNLNTAYYIQYEMPDSRFVDHVEIYMDAEDASGDLSRTGATLVYSGNNTSYMYKIGANDLDKYHQFWVEVVES